MSKIILGKYVNTHGIKGEIRIKSNFKYKERVFKIGNKIIIDNCEYIINSYRVHKGYDMITLNGIDDINKIPFNKNTMVYVNREDYLDNSDYLDSDLIGFTVYNSKLEKKVLDINYLNNMKKLLKVENGYIPFELIINIDFENKKIKNRGGFWIMKIDILTLFPDMYIGPFSESIIKRAREMGKVEINIHNFRDYTKDPHGNVDDTPYGGGSGMVLMCQPIFDCINNLKKKDTKVIMMTPSGKVYNQRIAYDLSLEKHLIILCGHYEGFDERIRSICDMEISIGDYVLTGGEIPSMILVDSIIRLIPGVIDIDSSMNESFNNNLLDYPVYTKPRVYNGMKVPEVLLSGNHKLINEYRKNEQIRKTKELRPDLLGDDYDDKI